MRVWTLNELFRLTRAELFALHRCIVTDMAALPDGHSDRDVALANLRAIRPVLGPWPLAPACRQPAPSLQRLWTRRESGY